MCEKDPWMPGWGEADVDEPCELLRKASEVGEMRISWFKSSRPSDSEGEMDRARFCDVRP
jgi:hypothetical protein